MKINQIHIVLLLVFICPFTDIMGQNYITVSGKVVDSETGEPLIFASIGIQNKSIGTISNTIGEFDFHVPMEEISSVLEIHMLGYKSFSMTVEDVLERRITLFKLAKSPKLLEEVIVSDSLSGGDIFSIAVNRINLNYPEEPFMLDGFYRDVKSVGGTYIALLEAAVKIYDKNYIEPKQKLRLREKVSLIELRKSLGYDNKFTSFFDQTNLLEDLLLHNNVRYRQFPEQTNFEFLSKLIRTNVNYYNGRRIFLIKLKDSDHLKFFIDAETYAFIRIEYDLGKSSEVIDKRGKLTSRRNSLQKILEFKEYSGKMYLSHLNIITEINWYENQDEFKFQTKLHQQLLINKVYPVTAKRIESSQTMKRFGLQYQQKRYNKEFWDNYNVIKETPLDKAIVEDLERDISLEKQFEKN